MNFFNQISYSITKPSSYKEMAERGIGRSILYICLLTTILFLIWVPVRWSEFSFSLTTFNEELKDNVPEFNITNGKLSIDVQQPYFLSKEEGKVFVIDTTGKFKPEDLNNYNEGFLVTKDKFYQYTAAQSKTYDLKNFEGLNKASLIKYFPYIKIFGILGFVFVYLWLILLKFIVALILSIIGLLVNSTNNKFIPYGQIFSMALYAWTLPMIIDTAFNIIGIDFFGNGMVRLFIGILYLVLAIMKSPTQSFFNNVNDNKSELK